MQLSFSNKSAHYFSSKSVQLNPQLASMGREIFIFSCGVADYNAAHARLGIKYIPPDLQREFVRIVAHR